jgi:hypothetical protein
LPSLSPNSFFLVSTGGDQLTLPQEASDLAVDMLKLGIAIWTRRAFQSLRVCLQAIAQFVQQLGHQTVTDAVTATAQFLGDRRGQAVQELRNHKEYDPRHRE